MLSKDTDIEHIKHEVLLEVAKLCFTDKLEEEKEYLPMKLIPGPQANYRCCIYREREIIRQRIRIAEGRPSTIKGNNNIVQVITSACEGCPIARYVVTDTCRKCVGRKCKGACPFDAITIGKDRAYIDPSKCKECGKCKDACPYNAIADNMRPCKRSCPVDAITMDENNIVVIKEAACISCGACIKGCPFGAITERSFLVDVIRMLKEKSKEVYAMLAPAWEGQFGDKISFSSMVRGLKDLGFKDVYEVSLGADLVAKSEGDEWIHALDEGLKMTTSCCPAFVTMVKKHFPSLVPNMSKTISPMTATAKVIKAMNPNAICVFIGPCIAKKGEVLDTVALNGADYALTFEELHTMLQAKDISLEVVEESQQQGSLYGKKFCASSGVSDAVLSYIKDTGFDTKDIKAKPCNGASECKKALTLLKLNKLPEDFIEGMVCIGGCKDGPGNLLTGRLIENKREQLFKKADNRSILDTNREYEKLDINLHYGE